MQHNQANVRLATNLWNISDRDKIPEKMLPQRTAEAPNIKQIEANIALCSAIAEEKQSKQTTERRKMVRRQTNEDLRQLEYKLRAAYISKAVAAQSFEAKQLAIEEKSKTHHENQILQSARLTNHEYEVQCTREAERKKMTLKQDLQAQMDIKEAKRRMEKQAKIEDRKQMDEVAKQYQDELQNNQLIFNEQKIRIRKEMDEFEAIQKKWREDHSTPGEQEQQRYEELLALQEKSRLKFLQERKDLQAWRALKSEEMGKENNKAAELKIKSFEFLTDLLVDERNANEDMKFAQDNERKWRERINFRNDLIEQCKRKVNQKMEEKKENEKLHREIMRVVEERDAILRIKDEKKRRDVEMHRKALLHALDEKRRLKVKEMKRLLMIESNEQADLQRKQKEIEKSTAEIIADHASALRGFLAPSVVRASTSNISKI